MIIPKNYIVNLSDLANLLIIKNQNTRNGRKKLKHHLIYYMLQKIRLRSWLQIVQELTEYFTS